MSPATRHKPSEHGAVTAELAILLPAVLALFFVALWAVGAVITNIRCIDAARDTARAAARGEPPASAERIGQRSAPSNASITIARSGNDITVEVTATQTWPLLKSLPSLPAKAKATIQSEPTNSHVP